MDQIAAAFGLPRGQQVLAGELDRLETSVGAAPARDVPDQSEPAA
jgi:hypothetical protein